MYFNYNEHYFCCFYFYLVVLNGVEGFLAGPTEIINGPSGPS